MPSSPQHTGNDAVFANSPSDRMFKIDGDRRHHENSFHGSARLPSYSRLHRDCITAPFRPRIGRKSMTTRLPFTHSQSHTSLGVASPHLALLGPS